MLGKNNGVIALLQAMQPSVVPVHCSGHKLELAYKDAIKNTALAEKVITMLIGLYYLYRVPLNRTNLKNAFRCLGFKKTILYGQVVPGGLAMHLPISLMDTKQFAFILNS